MMQLLDLGFVSAIVEDTQPAGYTIAGIHSFDEVDHLVATIEDPTHMAVVEL
jgi:hypothetical protein